MSENLIEVKDLKRYFTTKRGLLHAVDGVSFSIGRGQTLGLVGESGCGKSTTGRAILRLLEPTAGQVLFEGEDIVQMDKKRFRRMRQKLQIVFQDPYASLNPRMSVSEIIAEPLIINKTCATKAERQQRIRALMDTVGLASRLEFAYPHELDGGRRQRIGVARALALEPSFIVCDEPVSALDVSIQAQVLNLLQDLQESLGLTYLFISHDLGVIKHVSRRVAVMYLGKIVEMSDYRAIFEDPRHPYTRALLSAIPVPDVDVVREQIILEGDVTSPINPPEGCRFFGRCYMRLPQCETVTPQLVEHAPDRYCACHLVNPHEG